MSWNGKTNCDICGSDCNFKYINEDYIDLMVVEKSRICNICDNIIDYWAYGHWENSKPD